MTFIASFPFPSLLGSCLFKGSKGYFLACSRQNVDDVTFVQISIAAFYNTRRFRKFRVNSERSRLPAEKQTFRVRVAFGNRCSKIFLGQAVLICFSHKHG